MTPRLQLHLSGIGEAVDRRLSDWGRDRTVERLWNRDHTVWFPDDRPELSDRLGWLDLPAQMPDRIPDLEAFAAGVAAEGFRHAVVLGMGGSSLAPEVFQATFGHRDGYPRLLILDSTHPAAVTATAATIDLSNTLFVVSSKSGGTLETTSFFKYFWRRVSELASNPGRQFVAITDPGTSLAELAADRGFRATFHAPPDVGGRYSALTPFGLVPAALIGADLPTMAAGAALAADACRATAEDNPGARLGAVLGEGALAGKDKATFLTSPSLAALPPWIEQLVAESTGKAGVGIVPIGDEPVEASYPSDRLFVVIDSKAEPQDELVSSLARNHPTAHLTVRSATALAEAMFTLEFAVAASGAVLGINPFDQPDVQLAKELTQRAMEGIVEDGDLSTLSADDPDLVDTVRTWLHRIAPGDYIGIHAYLPPTAATRRTLEAAGRSLRLAAGVAATLDFGPRFLHSTGQLHKGGPDTGHFLQLVDQPNPDVSIPETSRSFGTLVAAQSVGDYQALTSRGRSVLRIALRDGDSLGQVVEAINLATGA